MDDWTPQKGLIRGCISTASAAVILAAVWGVLAYQSPTATIDRYWEEFDASTAEDLVSGRTFYLPTLAIGLSFWILFAVMHRTSGMIGGATTWVVVGLAIAVICAKHVALAVYGVPILSEQINGISWLRPDIILFRNTGAWLILAMMAFMDSKGYTIGSLFGR